MDGCPLAAHGLWRTPVRAQFGISHSLSLTQSAAGFSANPVGGWLVAMDGAHLGEDFRLCQGSNVVGAGVDVDVAVTSPGMSSKHARITCFGRGGEVEDIGGKGGVVINGEPVRLAALQDGDDLRFGGCRFIFRTAARFEPGYRPSYRPRPATKPVQTVLERRYIMGWLVARNGELIGRDFRLVRGDNRIGSAPDIEIHLVDAALTELACVIRCDSEGVHLMIPSPENQGLQKSRALLDSDELSVGTHEFWVKLF